MVPNLTLRGCWHTVVMQRWRLRHKKSDVPSYFAAAPESCLEGCYVGVAKPRSVFLHWVKEMAKEKNCRTHIIRLVLRIDQFGRSGSRIKRSFSTTSVHRVYSLLGTHILMTV